jgi:preprotein translocase subunit YajC
MQILIPILFLVGVYFLLLRPQQQRVRRQKDVISAIGVGDRVVTAGGLVGRVVEMSDDRLLLEVADGVVVELLRLAVSRRLDETESSFEAMGSSLDDELEGSSPDDELEEEYGQGDYGEAVDGEVAQAPEVEEAPVAAASADVDNASKPPMPTIPDGTIEEAAAPAPKQDPH